MTREAQAHAEEDKQYKDKIEARNKLDNLVYNTEKILRENRDKVSDSEAASVETALANAKRAMDSASETSELNSAVEELTRASHKLAEMMYQKTAGQAQQAGTGTKTRTGKQDDEVIDAEYVDVDEKK